MSAILGPKPEERTPPMPSEAQAERLVELVAGLKGSAGDADGLIERLPSMLVPPAEYALYYALGGESRLPAYTAVAGRATREALGAWPPPLPELDWAHGREEWVCTESEDAPAALRKTCDLHASLYGASALQLVPFVDGEAVSGVVVLGYARSGSASWPSVEVKTARAIIRLVELTVEQTRSHREARAAVELRDQVLAVVAHDLRNPLNVIALTTDSLLGNWPSDPAELSAVRDQMGVMKRSAERMRRLVGDLLAIAQLELNGLSLDLVRCDPSALVREAHDTYHALAAGKAVRLRMATDRSLPPVTADPERVLQVFGNLVENALQYAPPDSVVRLRARAGSETVRFEVVDQGPGVAPEDRARIFERFSRGVQGRGLGAGLGLAIARGIVEGHGGRIGVTSGAEGGATFFFTLPRADCAAGARPGPGRLALLRDGCNETSPSPVQKRTARAHANSRNSAPDRYHRAEVGPRYARCPKIGP